jgi:putative ABC transport system permease protein
MRLALRNLAREKAFTAFAMLTLCLGIGAVTAIFSIVDVVLLKPLRYKDPGRLYAAAESAPKLLQTYPGLPVNGAHFRSWQEQCRSCESAALLNPASFNLTGGGDPERIEGAFCTWRVFEVLGSAPQLGRVFAESDDQPGANRFVVVSDSFWRRRLGADRSAVGKVIQIDGDPHIVIGVLPSDFHLPSGDKLGPLNQFPKNAEIFKPFGFTWSKLRRVGSFNFAALVRLRPEATPAQAEAEMTAAVADAARDMKIDLKARLVPLQEQMTGRSRGALTLLLVAVGAVLLIVCVNLGSLMLARAGERSRDAAICRALGAGAADLFRPVLMESLLIALGGGAQGLMLAHAGICVLVTSAPVDIPRLDEVHISVSTWLFGFCISVACGMLCGLWPAFRATTVDPADALRSGSRGATEGRARQRSREWLVGAEVALSTVLLVMAALLGISFFRVTGVERGFSVDHVLTVDLTLPRSRYPHDDQRASFHQRALERLEALPSVRSAGLVSSLPLKAQMWGDSINREGDERPRSEHPIASYRFISEHYFDAMGVALRQGRFPTVHDRTQRIALVSEAAAHKAWPGESPVGKLIRSDTGQPWVQVIGVVADVRTNGLEKEPPPMVYVPYWDGKYWQGMVWGNATYAIRTSSDSAALANAVRGAMRELDAELPLANLLTMGEVLSESLDDRRFQTILAVVFAGAALILACLGIYGVIAYSVARRTNEIGIRIALGAQASQVSMLILRQGVRPVACGLVAGVAGALVTGEWIRSFLFGTEARDPAAIAAVALVLMLVAAAACWAPARRASRVDPMSTLRNE